MTTGPHIIQEGSLLLHWGELDETCLDRSKIWCEYYDPGEITSMMMLGASREWINDHIIDIIDESESPAWYAPATEQPMPRCEIMGIAATLRIGEVDLNGYLTVVSGEIASASIFLEGEQIILSLALGDHNREALQELARQHQFVQPRRLLVSYVTHGKNPFNITSGSLHIPLAGPREADDANE
jgi:hypothetical protein